MVENKSEILHGTLDLMVLKTSRPWVRCMATGSRDALSNLASKRSRLTKARFMRSWFVCNNGAGSPRYGVRRKSNRRAKFYCITKTGRKQLSAEAANWERISGVLGRVLQIAERS